MLPTHHLDPELLMDYAAGTCSESAGLLIATHLALCPLCRDEVARMERLGGTLLDSAAAAPVDQDSLAKVMAKLDQPEPIETADRQTWAEQAATGPQIPRPLSDYVGRSFDDIQWRQLIPGLSEHRIDKLEGVRASLLRIRPGKNMPLHSHDGSELVMVLSGGYHDKFGSFKRGDVAIADADVEHQPIADLGEDCICLSITDAPLRLTGPIGRLINPFVRF